MTVRAVSAWEVAIKPELGIADVARRFREAARHLQARILPVRPEHIADLEKLPVRHRDPFDRLLIAQAVAGRLPLVTSDQAFAKYPEAACILGLDRGRLTPADRSGLLPGVPVSPLALRSAAVPNFSAQ